jgi:hypothetical protein
LRVQGTDALEKLSILRSMTALRSIAPFVVAAARDAQRPAQSCDAESLGVPPDEGVLHGSSRAKYAAAFFKISRSSVTFASSRLTAFLVRD